MKNHKTFTALIVVSLVLILVGFASMAYATVAPVIDGKAAITEGKTIDTASSNADQVVTQKIEVQKTNKAETKAPTETVAAEHVPKYTPNRSEDTQAEANYIVIKSEMDVGGMGGIALVAWQNGGGPTVGTAPMAIATRNTLAHTAAGFVLV
jgi:hypothetical protein